MAFTPIDEQTWERREYLEVFRQTAIYLTAEVDITPLYRHTKARGEKLYPALIWCAAAVLNRHVHFRYGRDEAGRIGIWDVLHPYYTVPRRDAPDLFAMKVTRFMPDYDVFRQDFQADYARAETCGRLLCDETLPQMSAVSPARPGLAFSAFSFGGDPQAGLHALRPAGEGPPGRGPDGAAGRRRVCPRRQRRRPHQRFFQRAGGNRRQTVSGLKEKETARGDACPCGRSSI